MRAECLADVVIGAVAAKAPLLPFTTFLACPVIFPGDGVAFTRLSAEDSSESISLGPGALWHAGEKLMH